MRFRHVLSLIAVAALALTEIRHARADVLTGASLQAKTQTQTTNDTYVAAVRARIKGHEREPAAQVFENIQLPGFKTVPAETLLAIMDIGYSRALGVTCTHCHVEGDFPNDDKRPKRAAREMAVMHRMINDRLAAMKELEPKPDDRSINCAACHRGAIDPRNAGSQVSTSAEAAELIAPRL